MIRALHPQKPKLVVIGNGMAGARLLEDVLALAPDVFDVTVFGDEPYGNYNRILLSHVLSGQETDDDIFLNTIDWYEENDITLYAGVRVTRVDRFAKVVFSDDGRTTPYDRLVVATGSRAFMPKMEGMYLPGSRGEVLLPGIFPFRTLDDTRAMIDYAQHDEHRKAVVVGGGLLGLEAARGLQRYGLDAPRADCVGERLQSRLSLGQLQRLGKAAAAYRQNDTTPGALTPSDLIRVASELRDPAIALEVGKAAAACRVLP